jgi:hypothetical protein
MFADAAEEFDVKVRTRTRENREDGVDTQAIVDALATLGASAAAVVLDGTDRARGRMNSTCSCGDCACDSGAQGDQSASGSTMPDISSEVERVASRMGLVNEDELAVLRKRISELERELGKAKPATKPATSSRKPSTKS